MSNVYCMPTRTNAEVEGKLKKRERETVAHARHSFVSQSNTNKKKTCIGEEGDVYVLNCTTVPIVLDIVHRCCHMPLVASHAAPPVLALNVEPPPL